MNKPTNGDEPVTKREFNEAMAIINSAFTKVAIKEEVASQFLEVKEQLNRHERILDAILKTLESIEGRIKDMPTQKDFEQLSDRVFALETKA